jgi:uncharacterized protein YndB with AHSA1/START domain
MSHGKSLIVTTPSDREIALARVFDAPRHLVFDAYTKPELLKRWFGPAGWTLVVCEIDLRVGGSYRYVMRKDTGVEMGMGGVYREIVRPERIVAAETFDDPWYEGEAIATTTLMERGGKTTLTTTVRYDSKAIRDAVLKTPMESGVESSYNRLAELLAAQLTAETRLGA